MASLPDCRSGSPAPDTSPQPSAVAPKRSLLGLPGELRNLIYDMVLSFRNRAFYSPQFVQISRGVNKECRRILYESNTLWITLECESTEDVKVTFRRLRHGTGAVGASEFDETSFLAQGMFQDLDRWPASDLRKYKRVEIDISFARPTSTGIGTAWKRKVYHQLSIMAELTHHYPWLYFKVTVDRHDPALLPLRLLAQRHGVDLEPDEHKTLRSKEQWTQNEEYLNLVLQAIGLKRRLQYVVKLRQMAVLVILSTARSLITCLCACRHVLRLTLGRPRCLREVHG